MEFSRIITAVLTLLLIIPIPVTVVMLTVYFIKYGQRKNPPYHSVNESGDVTVYLFEWSRGSKSLSSKYGGKYHEYLFINTVNGLKYVRSDNKKLADILFFIFFTFIFAVFLFQCFSEGKFNFTYFIVMFSVYIESLILLFSVEYANLRLAKKYLKENNFTIHNKDFL